MGLSALLGGGEEVYAPESERAGGAGQVSIEFLRPSPLQPRRRFDEAELEALAASIRERGILQPLLVRPCANGVAGYEIVAGERRWRAAQRAGLHEVSAVVRLSDQDTLELALVENIQRTDLSPLEEAQGFRRLIDEFGHTQESSPPRSGRAAATSPTPAPAHAARRRAGAGRGRQAVGRPRAGPDRARRPSGSRVRWSSRASASARPRSWSGARRRARAKPGRAASGARIRTSGSWRSGLTSRLGLEVGIRARGKGGLLIPLPRPRPARRSDPPDTVKLPVDKSLILYALAVDTRGSARFYCSRRSKERSAPCPEAGCGPARRRMRRGGRDRHVPLPDVRQAATELARPRSTLMSCGAAPGNGAALSPAALLAGP